MSCLWPRWTQSPPPLQLPFRSFDKHHEWRVFILDILGFESCRQIMTRNTGRLTPAMDFCHQNSRQFSLFTRFAVDCFLFLANLEQIHRVQTKNNLHRWLDILTLTHSVSRRSWQASLRFESNRSLELHWSLDWKIWRENVAASL